LLLDDHNLGIGIDGKINGTNTAALPSGFFDCVLYGVGEIDGEILAEEPSLERLRYMGKSEGAAYPSPSHFVERVEQYSNQLCLEIVLKDIVEFRGNVHHYKVIAL
jgi:hypothetical protein